MKKKQQIIEELTKIVELHINGEDTRRQFIEDADSWLSQTLDTFEQEVREDERWRILDELKDASDNFNDVVAVETIKGILTN